MNPVSAIYPCLFSDPGNTLVQYLLELYFQGKRKHAGSYKGSQAPKGDRDHLVIPLSLLL